MPKTLGFTLTLGVHYQRHTIAKAIPSRSRTMTDTSDSESGDSNLSEKSEAEYTLDEVESDDSIAQGHSNAKVTVQKLRQEASI